MQTLETGQSFRFPGASCSPSGLPPEFLSYPSRHQSRPFRHSASQRWEEDLPYSQAQPSSPEPKKTAAFPKRRGGRRESRYHAFRWRSHRASVWFLPLAAPRTEAFARLRCRSSPSERAGPVLVPPLSAARGGASRVGRWLQLSGRRGGEASVDRLTASEDSGRKGQGRTQQDPASPTPLLG